MRIFVISYELPPIGGGGGRAALDTCRGLAKRGHEVHIITAHMEGLKHHETVDGIEITRVSSLRRRAYIAGILAMMGYVIAGFWAGLRHLRSWRPDVIHTHFAVPSGPVAWLLSRLSGIPYVLTAHLGDIPGGVPQKTSAWFRWVYPLTPPIWRDASQVVAVSEYSRRLALEHYEVDIKVIPNGIDLNLLDPGTIQVHEPPNITFAGRFMHQKNLITLVRVMAQLKDLDWRFIMLGDGPLRMDIEHEIAKADLQERFMLTGWVSTDEVTASFKDSDILFMPSLIEGLPIAGVQALAMGLAIVGSRVGGLIDLVLQGKNGYQYAPDNVEAMQTGLRELISKPETLLKFRKRSREHAKRFGIDRVVEDYIQIFENVISG